MKKEQFETKVKKQLWFLNKKEKGQLNQVLNDLENNETNSLTYKQPIKFSNQFLRTHIFKQRNQGTASLFLIIVGMLLINALLLGLFLFGLLTSLSVVQYFVNPQVNLSFVQLALILIGGIISLVVASILMKVVTAFFTKKLLEHRFNQRHEKS
ncbi:hypothetical protein BU015_09745 [Staphylococcus simulans]|uniref:hypothetical protein n=1 Tax=Staphylococcus simulans TaxID=1286 RepID=UPI000E6A3488|nr:hypothetical protein [Staphylococcus simulans]RIN76240.1 hypothetical protein BU015_09745 [Staphylococcus simulans]